MNETLTRDAKRINEALTQCQAGLSNALLNSVKNQRNEMKDMVHEGYDTVKQKTQEFIEKSNKAQEKLGGQVADFNAKLEDRTKQTSSRVEYIVSSNPWMALVVALALGAAIAFLLKPSFKGE